MDISRYGALRYRGTTSIVSGLSLKAGNDNQWLNSVQWNTDTKQIIISAAYVPYGDGHTHHNYRVCLSLDDVVSLVTLLGHAGSAQDASLLRDRLNEHIPALVKLLACATGLVPGPMEPADTEAKDAESD
jgi:hypothetical protein